MWLTVCVSGWPCLVVLSLSNFSSLRLREFWSNWLGKDVVRVRSEVWLIIIVFLELWISRPMQKI